MNKVSNSKFEAVFVTLCFIGFLFILSLAMPAIYTFLIKPTLLALV